MFHPEMIVAEALDAHPSARWVFAAYHIGGCRGCSRATDETLAQVAEGYRLPLDQFLRDLNALVEAPTATQLHSSSAIQAEHDRTQPEQLSS